MYNDTYSCVMGCDFLSQNAWILLAFGIYFLVMLGIGAFYYKKTKSSSDYFLGGRSLGGWVAAMSAQASDMSGWLLMGLPGAIYAAGTGQIWIGVGLAIGTMLNWIFISKRLRRYTIVSGNSVTLPTYFQNRFKSSNKVLSVASAVFIMIFFLVYTASGFSAVTKLFVEVFHLDYVLALAIGAVVIVGYTFLGGFLAVCWTDFVQGMMMLVALLAIPILAVGLLGGPSETFQLLESNAPANYLNPFVNADGSPMTFVQLISQLAWALGYFGMPHILVRFMAIRSDSEVKKSRVIAIVWVVLALIAASLAGIIGRVYLTTPLEGGATENVFINSILQMFTDHWYLPFLAGILLCGILAAAMSTADSQLLVTASSFSEDIYKNVIDKKASNKKMIWIGRITVLVVAIIAFLIALNPENSVMGLVSNAWSGFGSAFGATVVLSLFWKRANYAGAVSGVISGGLTVIIWDYIPLFAGQTLSTATGLYSLAVGFPVSLVFIIIVSLLTKKPSQEVLEEFELAASSKEIDIPVKNEIL